MSKKGGFSANVPAEGKKNRWFWSNTLLSLNVRGGSKGFEERAIERPRQMQAGEVEESKRRVFDVGSKLSSDRVSRLPAMHYLYVLRPGAGAIKKDSPFPTTSDQ